jgi:hypothetical protein
MLYISRMAKLLCSIVFILISLLSFGQAIIVDSSFTESTEKSVLGFYNTARKEELSLFNGTLHYGYSPAIEGIAYYKYDTWQTGTVEYDGIVYSNVMMKYDLVTDKLIVQTATGNISIALFSPRVKGFSFSGHKFTWLQKKDKSSLPEGFYEIVAEGKATLYVRSAKIILEEIINNTLQRKFEETTKYYILKEDGIYYQVSNKNSLLSILREKRREVQDFISKRKLKYRIDAGSMIPAAVQIYNQD